MQNNKIKRKISTTRLIVLGFIAIILIGTLLLMLPVATSDGTSASFTDALFTVVSASCVTGLTVVDTATYWSSFGHVVIIVLIQIGGLGFMTMATLLSLLVKRAVTPKERMLIALSYNLDSYDSTTQIVKRVAIGTAIIELIGAALLSIRFIRDFGFLNGIYKALFHSISAFCNAGFDIIGVGNKNIGGMSYYATDPLVNITLSLLIIIGGIGFIVWSDIINIPKKKKHLSIYSRFVILITLILLAVGTVGFALFEWTNPQTIGNMNVFEKIVASFFQSTTWRTAGFATINNGDFTQSSQMLGIILMFIGGASGSTAGGIKVATIGVLVLTVWCTTIGRKRTVFRGRTISPESFIRAVAVICAQLCAVIIGLMILSLDSGFDIMSIAYEVVSAISTVGLSLGITSQLPLISELTICFFMFFGRVGILTITLAIMENQSQSEPNVTYPDARMLIG